MFRGLISDAKAAAGAVIVKYVARASVAVPFLIAGGFATAALTVMLVDRYGAQTAYWLLAGGFTLIGRSGGAGRHGEGAGGGGRRGRGRGDRHAGGRQGGGHAGAAGPAQRACLPARWGPRSALGIARLLGRNLPLVLLLVIAGFLLWPSEPKPEGEGGGSAAPEPPPAPRPNGVYPEGGEARV